MADSDAERSQAPTQKRRDQARDDGNIWQPREIGAASALVVAALAAMLAGPALWHAMATLLEKTLDGAAPGRDDNLQVAALLPPLLRPWTLVAGLGAMVTLLSAGLLLAASRHVSLSALAPKPARLDPLAGLGRIFSRAGLAGAGTAVLKLGGIAGMALIVLPPLVPRLANIGEDGGGLAVVGGAIARLLGAAALTLGVVAVADAAMSFVLRESKLKMSLDEVRRENRQDNGSPEVKAAIRRIQFANATRRLRTSLADASVVVVNPVHFAVAMRYRPGEDAAPVVLEKGRLEAAQAIIAVAREMQLPVIRTPRLARALFFTARPGEPVREELFGAVATILAFVMRFDAPDADDAPPVFVPPDFDFDENGARRKAGAPLPL